jgi:creatinine amidohydrolase/Fe(II)-dependent formamide hydrolase-like protein
LSIPDVQSFIINHHGENKPAAKKRTKKAQDKESDEEITVPITSGSRSRPSKLQEANKDPTSPITVETSEQASATPEPQVQQQPKKEAKLKKIIYPSKRFKYRKEFLVNWKDFFSKQWDVCCEWHF